MRSRNLYNCRDLSATLVLASALAACSSSSSTSVGPDADAAASDGQGTSSQGPVDSGRDTAIDHVPDAHTASDARSDHSAHASDGSMDAHDAGRDANQTDAHRARDAGKDASGHDATLVGDSGVDGSTSDSGVDAQPDVAVPVVDASVCPNGMGTIVLVGGSAHLAFGASSVNGGPWSLTAFSGNTVDSAPAVSPYGTGFLSVFSNSTTTDVLSTAWSVGPASWSTPVAVPATMVGGAPATELGSPALAVLGPNAELVYQGSNDDYYHGIYANGAWGAASDPVGGSTVQDIGLSPPAAAAAHGVLYAAYDGTDNGLYVDSWTPSTWGGPQAITGAGTSGVPSTMIALTGGATDLILVYNELTTTYLKSVVHTAGSGWSAPVQVSSTATASTAVSLAPLANGGAVMVYQGTNGLPYGATYDVGSGAWTTPVSVYPNSQALQSPPTVAPGVCGVDAIAALTETEGVEIVTLSSGVWSPPVLIDGTQQITYAAVATTTALAAPLPDGGSLTDASGGTGGDATMMTVDSGAGLPGDASIPSDAPDASLAFSCPTGSGAVALIGGSSTNAFGATTKNGGAWKVDSFSGETVGAVPAIVPYGGAFLALFPASLSGTIVSTRYTNVWSTQSGLQITGGGNATEQGGPALAVLGMKAELVYQGSDNHLYHGEYAQGAWGTASDPVGGSVNQDYGPSQPTTAVAGGVLYAAYDGSDNGLYVDSWLASRGWGDEVAIVGAGVGSIPPTLVALKASADGGASPDLMLVFEFQDTNLVYSTVHTPAGPGEDAAAGSWAAVQQLSATANTFNRVALAALPGGNVQLVYEGEDGFPYASTYTLGSSSWSSPAAVYAAGGSLLSPPSLAPGVCGYDAIATLVEENGVAISALTGNTWSTPVLIEGLSGTTYASLATTP